MERPFTDQFVSERSGTVFAQIGLGRFHFPLAGGLPGHRIRIPPPKRAINSGKYLVSLLNFDRPFAHYSLEVLSEVLFQKGVGSSASANSPRKMVRAAGFEPATPTV